MKINDKLVWWEKILYISILIMGLGLGGAERGGYLLADAPIFVILVFYIVLVSVIGFAWDKLKPKNKEDDNQKGEA